MTEKYKDFIRSVEGVRLMPYHDSKGVLTIGYGRNLIERGISIDEAEFMLDNDIAGAVSDLLSIFPNFFSMPVNEQTVLVSMMFNLGKTRFLSFKKFIHAVKIGDKKMMVYELLNSKRAKELKNRVAKEQKLLMEV